MFDGNGFQDIDHDPGIQSVIFSQDPGQNLWYSGRAKAIVKIPLWPACLSSGPGLLYRPGA